MPTKLGLIGLDTPNILVKYYAMKSAQKNLAAKPSASAPSRAGLFPLEDAVLALVTKEEVTRFLIDLCTPSEITAFRQRWMIAQLLDKNVSHRKAAEQSDGSVATVARVARFLQHERHRGYRLVLDRLQGTKSR